jgi:hypothetical protein
MNWNQCVTHLTACGVHVSDMVVGQPEHGYALSWTTSGGARITIVGSPAQLIHITRKRALATLRAHDVMECDATHAVRERKVDEMRAGWSAGWDARVHDLDPNVRNVHEQHAADAKNRYARLTHQHQVESVALWRESILEEPVAYFEHALSKARAVEHARGLEAIPGPAAAAPKRRRL